MNRVVVRYVVTLAVAAAVCLQVADASATVRPQRPGLSKSQRTLVHHASSLAATGVRTVVGAARRLRAPAPRKPVPPPIPVPPPTPISPPPPTTITVDAADPGATISPGVFGSDYLAPLGGMGSTDSSGALLPSFTAQVDSQVLPGSLRFPGGITAQAYRWQNAIGPQDSRLDNPVGPNGRPSPSTVGPDEFGSLLDQTGAAGVVDVDSAVGNAQDAADFVHYMTDPAGSGAPAAQRAANGHPAPYDVPYWEVGNEEQTPQYWRAGSRVSFGSGAPQGCMNIVNACLYIYGGTTSFANQRVVGLTDTGDRSPGSALSNGQGGQQFQVQFPPVASPSSTTFKVFVNGAAWTLVATLPSSGAPDDYTLDPTTGTITFGNGTTGAIPPPGAVITTSYRSGPHDGFNAFYAAMKQANPSIQVCATDTAVNFVDAMGTQPYDCLQDHPYVGSGDVSPALPIDQYESRVMAVPDVTETAAVQTLQAEADDAAGRHVPLVLTEYGQLINSTPQPAMFPFYMNSLDEALINASQLADWIRLGVALADRQLLAAELPSAGDVTSGLPGNAPFAVTGAITTPGPFSAGAQTVLQPTGQFLGLMKPLAGGAVLSTAVGGNPPLTTASDGTTVGALSAVAALGAGTTRVVVINRSPVDDVTGTVALSGGGANGAATVTTLDGPSALSDNTAIAPATVTTSSRGASVSDGSAVIDFPAHSISLVTLPAG